MSKTVQEIMEVMGKTVEASMVLERKSGSSYAQIADIKSEDINELRYYFDGALYCSVMRCLEVKLKGNWTDRVKKGLLLDGLRLILTHPEGDKAEIGYGCFIIAEEPEYDAAQNTTSVIAYDELYPSMQPYAMSLDWTNGITVKNYLIAILNKLDIAYDENSLKLMANADVKITSEKFIDVENDNTESAYTYRDVLDEIAKASGVTFGFKNSIGGDPFKLYAIKPVESGYIIDESNLHSVSVGAKYGPVKAVMLSREPQEDNVYLKADGYKSTDATVKISNVEIMEDTDNNSYRENFMSGILSNVLNTEYYLYELDSYGIGFLNFGDIFTLKVCNREGGVVGAEKSYKTIFMRTDMTIGNGVKEKSKLEAPQATSPDYTSAATTDKTLKKTMIKVDKQEQRITALVKESDDKYSEFTQTVNGIKGEIVDTKSGLEAKIAATAEAATSQYTALKTEIKENYVANSTYNTFVNQTAEKISTQAESIKNIQDARYITEERCNSLIEAQSDKITLSVEENLKIGTRNILLNSECFAGFTPTKYKVNKALIYPSYPDTYVPSGKYSQVIFTADSTGGDTGITRGIRFVESDILGQSTVDKVKPNTTYTLSFWLKTDGAFSHPGNLVASSAIYAGEGVKVTLDTNRSTAPALTTSWQKYVLTFKITGSISNFYIMLFFTDCLASTQYRVDISSFKLEEGNIATDWTPSAEDIDQSVKAQISMCVQKDKNNKLTSAIAIEGNMISIKSNKFELTNEGAVICNDLTCVRIFRDEEVGTEDITSMKITNATISHTFNSRQIGQIGVKLDLIGTYYEAITAGDACGVMLESNGGNGYRAAIYDSGFTVTKGDTSASLTLLDDTGFGIVHKGNTFGVGMQEWDYGNISSAEQMLLFSDCGMVIGSQDKLCLQGNSGVWLCGTVRLTDYFISDTKGTKKPLYVDTNTGIIST